MTQPDAIGFAFDNSYARDLEGMYTPWRGADAPEPRIVRLNRALASELGLDADALDTDAGAAILSGKQAPDGASPLAQAYAGHQFGGFSPLLGDGRALLLGELVDRNGQRRDLHLKGSGRTPYARGGDGKAVLGPILREYVMGEAMHALGIPTTRALAVTTTGEAIIREGEKPGAVLARIASSHLRVGTFQLFASRGETERLRKLADYAILRHDAALVDEPDKYLRFLEAVSQRQARLIAQWMLVGFIHGVMNTDNMAISGETIDYGPCAFMDAYDPATVFSSIDRNGRYAYGNQPSIAVWNLSRFAETLLDLIDPADTNAAIAKATDVLGRFSKTYTEAWLGGMRNKLGLTTADDGDAALIQNLLQITQDGTADYTLTFRRLADALRGKTEPLLSLFETPEAINEWLEHWQQRLVREQREPLQIAAAMDAVNTIYIPRNHTLQAALDDAESTGDLSSVDRLMDALAQPFHRREGLEGFELPAPSGFGPFRTFCGT
jgi:uncharacterized protein YdiU (UPF0061 family)